MKILVLILSVLITFSCAKDSGSSLTGNNTTTGAPGETPGGPVSNFKITCEEARFVYLLNIYRQNNGLSKVSVSRSGVIASRWHAQDMIDKTYFAHTEPNGRTFSERARNFGYPAHAENIAAGYFLATETFCQWKNSSGHNTNMLRSQHVTTGIGNALGGGYRSYWSNNFGPATSDTLEEPLTSDVGCSMPTELPFCG